MLNTKTRNTIMTRRRAVALLCGLAALLAVPGSVIATPASEPHLSVEVINGHYTLVWAASSYKNWILQHNGVNEKITVPSYTVKELREGRPPSTYVPVPEPGKTVSYRVRITTGVHWSNEVTITWPP
jgi:hypothetical protein